MQREREQPSGRHLVLYDGVCGLCDRMVRFIIRHDEPGIFRFAAQQGEVGQGMLRRFGKDPDQVETFYVIADFRNSQPRLLERSDGAIFVARELGGLWRAAVLLRVLPRPLRDAAYHFIATIRYRWFGKFDACPVPAAAIRGRFLD